MVKDLETLLPKSTDVLTSTSRICSSNNPQCNLIVAILPSTGHPRNGYRSIMSIRNEVSEPRAFLHVKRLFTVPCCVLLPR